MKKYKKVSDVEQNVRDMLNKPAEGIPCSYKSFGNKLTYLKKYFAIVYAMPTSGKSEWVLQECIYLSLRHGWKHLVFTPEMGDPEDIIALLIHKMTGESVNEIKGVPTIDPARLSNALDWIDKHFIFVETEESVTMEDLFSIVDEIERDLGWKADNLVIDNHNDLKIELDSNGRQDLQTERQLTYLRRQLKKRDMYAFLVTHTADMKAPLSEKGINGQTVLYYPIPDPTKTRGGQAFYRKGYLMINLWRCPNGLTDENGEPYAPNQTILTVQKAKPTHTAIKGFQANLYWDWRLSKFTDLPNIIRRT